MFSSTDEEHVEWLTEALERFKSVNLKLQAKVRDIEPVM